MSYNEHLLTLFGLSQVDVETVPEEDLMSYLTLRCLADIRSGIKDLIAVPNQPTAAPAPARIGVVGAIQSEARANVGVNVATGSIQNEKIGRTPIEGAPQGNVTATQPREALGTVGNEKIAFNNREEVMAIITPHTVGGVITANQKIMPNIQNLATARSANIPGGGLASPGHAPAQASIQTPATVNAPAVQTAPPVNQARQPGFTNVEAGGPQQVFTKDSQLPPVPTKSGDESAGRNISFN